MELDRRDYSILRLLVADSRISHVELAEKIGLSPTACARRIKALEEAGIIKGASVTLDLAALGFTTNVIVRITLEGQSGDHLTRFETAVARCPDVLSCWLMAGLDDYILHVVARDIPDYERIHKEELSKLPGVSRIQSSFALRMVVERPLVETALKHTAR